MQAHGSSDAGRVREENQDVFATREDLGLALLADGMGGGRAGGVAAELAVDAALEHLAGVLRQQSLEPQDLGAALKLANDRVVGMANAISAYRGMGTTLVAVAIDGAKSYIAHIGDSRVYRYHAGALTQITKDHSLVQDWVDSGVISAEEARHAPNRNVITRAIGAKPSVQADVTAVDLGNEDLLLLCSRRSNGHVDRRADRLHIGRCQRRHPRGLFGHSGRRTGSCRKPRWRHRQRHCGCWCGAKPCLGTK